MTDKKHIAIICNYELLEDRVGGMDYFFWAFNKKCIDENVEVDWFFPNTASYGDYNSLHIIPAAQTSLEQHFRTYIKTQGVQYTHIMTHFVELCTSFFADIKKLQKAKLIAVDHNPRPLQGYPLKKRIKKKLKGLWNSKYIDIFVAVSNHTKEALLYDFGNHIKDKVVVILNGLNVEKYIQKNNFSSHHKFMVASHLRKEKGIQDLILAAKNLKDHHFIIDIYGKGYYQDALKKMVKCYGLESKISFKGSVSNLHEIYHQYDYLIHPSHGETFGYAVVESLLSHLPVITTKEQGNVLGLVEETANGFLFEVNDVSALTALLASIIRGEKRIVSTTNKLVETPFLIETMVNNYIVLIED